MNVTKIRRPADMERITTPKLAKAFIEEQVALIKEQVGDKKVLLALSGGVDSSVVAALLIKAIGQQLVCVHVNHGLLRKGEPEQVIEVFRNQMNANLVYVDATDRFLDKLAGVDDPEKKRKIIGGEFIEVFAEEARKLDGIEFLAQGTIWPDILESEEGIKAHHNAGGLPEDMDFELVEPVRILSKMRFVLLVTNLVCLTIWFIVSHSQDRDLVFVVQELLHVIVLKQCASLMQFFVRSLTRTDLQEKSGSISPLFRNLDQQELKTESVLSSGAVLYVQYVQLTL